MRPRKPRDRRLSASEAALWRAVSETVTPLEPSPPQPSDPAALIPAAQRQPGPPRPKAAAQPVPPQERASPAPASKLEGGDPALARRVARGRRGIDASLDLHGLTQDQAHARLLRFVSFAAASGARTLLVVTGKGSDGSHAPFAEAPRGILRRRFLDWVEEAPLASRIASVRQAHQRHGGRGAFYVFLKRPRG